MNDSSIIEQYFPSISPVQKNQFRKIGSLYADWNQKINLISRKDIENFYVHHVLHSLSIAKVVQFEKGTRILDAGTGGGFPGIPLAILFPNVSFHLADSIGKKIKVVEAVSDELGLKNVTSGKSRVEDLKDKYDFVISRAVTTLKQMYEWTSGVIRPGSNNTLKNGILYLKGGDLHQELRELAMPALTFELSDFFTEDYFQTKKLVYISVSG